MARRLEGKVALVTGASRGIGRAIALAFAREGAAVGVNYVRNGEEAAGVVASIRGDGGQALAVAGDVADSSHAQRMVAQVTGAFGRLDVLVNNAGIIHRATLLDAVEAELDAMYAINVKGTWHMIRAAAPALKARGTGRIVNIASLAALGTAISGTSPYAATKAAVIALTKRAALELGRDGITVNAICPGFILTDMLAATAPGGGGNLAALADKTMVGRVGRPEDVAEAALYLAGDEAGFVTAQVLTVDGGRLDFLTHSA